MHVKLLSWNIWVDNKFDLVKDYLSSSGADILALQEVRADDSSRDIVSYLTSSLGYDHIFYPQPRPWESGRVDGPAIFSKYEITSSQKQLISVENGVGAVNANIKIKNNIYHVFSTHLSHTHQQESAMQLDQINKVISNIPTTNSILMGDFNAIPTSHTLQKVKEKMFDVDLQNTPTWSVYEDGCNVCQQKTVDIRLDYIFVTPDITTHSYTVGQSKGSDHLPISVIMDI